VAGVIVAAAALLRLGWTERITQYLPLDGFLPAVGQGALALEVRQGDADMTGIIQVVNHLSTWQSTTAERSFLSALGGGCRAPIAALATVAGGRLRMSGLVASEDGARVLSGEEEGEASAAGEIGEKLAARLLAQGAARLVAEVRR
jgi:hydroxymethylbilane synthase